MKISGHVHSNSKSNISPLGLESARPETFKGICPMRERNRKFHWAEARIEVRIVVFP